MIEPFAGNPNAVKTAVDAIGKVAGSIGEAVGTIRKHSHEPRHNRAQLTAVREAIAHDAKQQQENRAALRETLDATLGHTAQEAANDRAHQLNMMNRFAEISHDTLGKVGSGTRTSFSYGEGKFEGVAPESDSATPANLAARVGNLESSPAAAAPAAPVASDSDRAAGLAAKVATNKAARTALPAPASKPKAVSTKTKVMPVVKDKSKSKSKGTAKKVGEEFVNMGGIKPAEALEN